MNTERLSPQIHPAAWGVD